MSKSSSQNDRKVKSDRVTYPSPSTTNPELPKAVTGKDSKQPMSGQYTDDNASGDNKE